MRVFADIIGHKDDKKIHIFNSCDLLSQDAASGCEKHVVSIITVTSGKGEIAYADKTLAMSEGRIFVISGDGDVQIKHSGRLKAILITGCFDMLYQANSIRTLVDSSADGRKLAEIIFSNIGANEGYIDCLCSALVRYLLLNMKRPQKNTHVAIRNIIDKMEEGFCISDLSIGALLDESGYTRDYIRGEFESVTGVTPKKYLDRIRMEKAKTMLELCGDQLTISEIAEKCGVLDHTIFSRSFKRHYGISPSEYRETVKSYKQ